MEKDKACQHIHDIRPKRVDVNLDEHPEDDGKLYCATGE